MNQNEYNIQVAIVNWIHAQYPGILMTISPSGMKLPIGVATKLKRMGYRAGTPDLLILEPRGGFHGLFIELKSDTGRLSDHQAEFLEELNARKYHSTVCYGFIDAESTIKSYMNLPEVK